VVAAALVVAQGALVNVHLGRGSPSTLPVPAPASALGRAVDPKAMIADPDVLVGRRADYLYSSATGYSPPYLPVRTFHVLGRWGPPADAMPSLPAWADSWIWNPDVRLVGGRYVMWFTAPLRGTALPTTRGPPRCLGWATASSPLGPFRPAAEPSVCQMGWFGAIDPQTVTAPGGQQWLYWKSDGNSVPRAQRPTIIWAQRLAADGVTLEGRRVAILSDRQPWEGRWSNHRRWCARTGTTTSSSRATCRAAR
jgi:arabinan endo-1,5-alpha-L-arabinosidase